MQASTEVIHSATQDTHCACLPAELCCASLPNGPKLWSPAAYLSAMLACLQCCGQHAGVCRLPASQLLAHLLGQSTRRLSLLV